MAASVPVRCPACRREHSYTPPAFPCACGAPLTVPVLRGGIPVQVRHRSWADSWVRMRCSACGRSDDWPQPEFGCPCGATIRLPVDFSSSPDRGPGAAGGAPEEPGQGIAPPRPPFRPVTIRTADDAVTAAVRYLEWLGFTEVRRGEDRTQTGLGIRGRGVVAQVDGSIKPASVKDVECLWLNSLTEEVTAVFFALAGYTPEARLRAERLGTPLFSLDLTGTPQPVTEAAHALVRKGAAAADR